MKVLIINSVCGIRSTGRICTDLAEKFDAEGNEVKIAYGRFDVPEKYKKNAIKIGNKLSPYISALESRLLDNDGFNCKSETKKFLKWAEEYNPDLVWIHNIHDHYINAPMLFKWIKSRPQMQVKWTLHDCWAFTGHCTHFSYVKCYKWEKACEHCPQKKMPPKSILLDRSRENYLIKKESFTGVKDLTLITPSKWLADLVKQSFLKEYKTEVVHNTIDTNVFKPTPSDFRKKYHLEDKKIILGVAVPWTERKGIQDFYKLAVMLPSNYVIVLVGLSEKQIKEAPKQILGLTKTDSKKELAEIYSAADVFVNPSKEETFGLTTLEAASCGTKVIVLKDTACEEVADMVGGNIVEQSVDKIKEKIIQISGGGDNNTFAKNE